MENDKCIIFVPVHKSELNNYEYVSFARLCKLLGLKYKIVLVTYKELNVSEYINISNSYNTQLFALYFNKQYFTSRENYHLLVTDVKFYTNAKDYKYIFIYQLDCYLFKDNLDYWINMDFPQIECVATKSYINSSINFFNGIGLRNTQIFINFLTQNNHLVNMTRLCFANNNINRGLVFKDLGEDEFFTKYISDNKIPNCCKDFGFSTLIFEFDQTHDKIPFVIHNFQGQNEFKQLRPKATKYILDVIGDPDVDREACINKEFN